MTPKEKAIELVSKMLLDHDMYYDLAKECALIAVDEILDIVNSIYDYDREALEPYWDAVKQEIEKL